MNLRLLHRTSLEYAKPFISTQAIHRRVVELVSDVQKHFYDNTIILVPEKKDSPLIRDLIEAFGENVSAVLSLAELEGTLEPEQYAVLYVQDVNGTGQTLETALMRLDQLNIRMKCSLCFLQRPSSLNRDVEADYVGFSIPDEFVVGYGMGINGSYEDLPYVIVYDQNMEIA